jgi:hypothetical protein
MPALCLKVSEISFQLRISGNRISVCEVRGLRISLLQSNA